MSDVVLQVENVSKQYRYGQLNSSSLRTDLEILHAKLHHKENTLGKIGSMSGSGRNGEAFYALRDVSFEVKRGQAIALIGRNGAGKSTLLKLISRITAPTEGVIRYKGHVASLLEVGTGFNQLLTGRENIYLNGAILGMTRADITKRLDEIIDFSEIGPFIDTPVKRYSSGMYVKLGFAVAAHLDPDILICDEVLAVGDMRFQDKCIRKMSQLANEHTVIYVSHNMRTLRQLCNYAVYLDQGRMTYAGDLEHAISLYAGSSSLQDTHYDFSNVKHEGNMGRLARMEALDLLNVASCEYEMGGRIFFRLKTHAHEDVNNLRVSVQLSRAGTDVIASSLSEPCITLRAGETVTQDYCLPLDGLAPGEYDAKLWLYIVDPLGRMISYDIVPNAFRFAVVQNLETADGMKWIERRHGLFRLHDVERISPDQP